MHDHSHLTSMHLLILSNELNISQIPHFTWSQKHPKCKTNSTEVFLTIKRTTVWKIIPIQLHYHTQNTKQHFRTFDEPTNSWSSLILIFVIPSRVFVNDIIHLKSQFSKCFTSNSNLSRDHQPSNAYKCMTAYVSLLHAWFVYNSKLRLWELALLAIKKFQTTKLTPQKSS